MHTKNLPIVIIPHCPLSSKFTFSKSTPYIRRCLEIIESARIVWGYYSDEYKSCCYETVDGVEVPKKFPPYSTLKLTSARSIQSWYVEHSDLFLASQKNSEAIKKAVSDVRRSARPGIESSITDKEILAIFAICEGFDAIKKIQGGKPGEAVKEAVLASSTFLKLAKAGFEPERQDTAKQDKFIPFPIPSGVKVNDIKMIFLDDENIRITIKGKSQNFHYGQMGFFNKQTNRPLKRWGTLLEYAENRGVLIKVTNKKQKDSERINEKLKAFFETNENLIIRNQNVFNIDKKTSKGKKPVNVQRKICPSCKETHKHFCFVCNDEMEHCQECHEELYKETHAKLNR